MCISCADGTDFAVTVKFRVHESLAGGTDSAVTLVYADYRPLASGAHVRRMEGHDPPYQSTRPVNLCPYSTHSWPNVARLLFIGDLIRIKNVQVDRKSLGNFSRIFRPHQPFLNILNHGDNFFVLFFQFPFSSINY